MRSDLRYESAVPVRARSLLLSVLVSWLATNCIGAMEVGVLSTFEKVLPETKALKAERRADLAAARNEREAFQLVLQCGAETLRSVTVTTSALRHKSSGFQIPASQTELRLVGYTLVKEPSWRGPKRSGRWPDPMLELRPFDVPPGENRCVWVTVSVPDNSPAGDYTGKVTVQTGNSGRAVLPLALHVWDFTLPRQVHLATSYWMAKEWVTKLYPNNEGLARADLSSWKPFYDVFGKYRLCTDLWVPSKFVRREDGTYGVNVSQFVEHLGYFLRTWRPWVVQVGSGCWGGSFFENIPLHDAETGEPLQVRDEKTGTRVPEKAPLSPVEAMRRFYDALRPQLRAWGVEGRVYLQLWDEPNRDTWDWGVKAAYTNLFQAAPDIPGLCVVGIHPELQGFLDIFCPHTHFADPEVYEQVREGISLKRAKAVPAEVTASSTGGWGNAAFYTYRPGDAYDGCSYTLWTSKEPPTAQNPEWLQFAFRKATRINGVKLIPKEGLEPVDWSVGVSFDGQSFSDVSFKRDESDAWSFHFDPVEVAFVRFTFRSGNQKAAEEPAPRGVGLREVEFLGPDLPREEALPRERVRKARVWEYNVGADYPSFCIDSPAIEHRAIAWLCWERGVEGFLYYGGGLWPEEWKDLNLPMTQPLDWPDHPSNGGQYLIYPGPANPPRPLPSLRLAVMGEGMEDYEYLWLLREHLIASRLGQGGRGSRQATANAEALLAQPLPAVRTSPDGMMAHRRKVAEAIEALSASTREPASPKRDH